MKRKKRSNTITEQQFEVVKLLRERGVKQKTIALAVHLGTSTVTAMCRFNTLKEYQDYTRECNRKYQAKKEAKEEYSYNGFATLDIKPVVYTNTEEPSHPTALETENIITPSLEGILREIQQTNKLLSELINSKTQNDKGWWSR